MPSNPLERFWLFVSNRWLVDKCSRFFHLLIGTERSIWSDALKSLVTARHITPHSFQLESLSLKQMRALAETELRLEHLLHTKAHDPILKSVPITQRSCFRLNIPPKVAGLNLALLPGGRWLLGFMSNHLTRRYEAMCWDLADLEKVGSSTEANTPAGEAKILLLEPVATISSLQEALIELDDYEPSTIISSEYDASTERVNYVWRYPFISEPSAG